MNMAKSDNEIPVDESILQHVFKKYVSKGHFCDVTLVSDDYQQFRAHKLLLAAHSPVLEALLLSCPQPDSSHTVLHVRGFSGAQLQKLVRLIYSREVSIDDDNELVELSSELKIQLNNRVSQKDQDKSSLNYKNKQGQGEVLKNLTEDHKVLNSNNVTLALVSDHKDKNKDAHDENVDQSQFEKEEDIILENTDPEFEYSIIDNVNDRKTYKIIDTEKKLECAICDEIFSEKKFLRKHYNRSHENEKIDVKCKICPKIFHDRFRLEVHFTALHGIQKYQCSVCDFKSGSKFHVQQHFKRNHSGQKFPCGECTYTAKDMKSLNLHKKSKHGMNGGVEKLKCDLCDAVLGGKASLRTHIKMTHELIRYPCSRCPYQASCKRYLIRHEEGKHDGKRFKCQICNYEAKCEYTLKKHVKVTHEGLRFYCDECTAVYSSKGQMKQHMKIKHNIEFSKRSYNVVRNKTCLVTCETKH